MNSALEIMYTKESTCGGFVEIRDAFLISYDKRNEDVSRGLFAANAHDNIDRTANIMDLRSDWNNYPQSACENVKVPAKTKEVTCGDNQYLGGSVADVVDCDRNRKRHRQNSGYAYVPNYPALPTRFSSEHVQLAKRRKLHEGTAGQVDAGQMYDAKRRKLIEHLDVGERNSDETKLDVFSSNVTFAPLHHQMEPWKRYPDAAAADAWNSTGSEGELIRGRFFRPVQPARHLTSSSEACPEEKERPVCTTSSTANLTGSREAKENMAAVRYASISRLSQQQNSDLSMNSEYVKTDSNRKFISDEYSRQLVDSTASPFTTTTCLHQSFQQFHRNSFEKLKSENDYHLRDSTSSSLSSAKPPKVNVIWTGGATFRKEFPHVEIPDPRLLAFRAQSESWRKRESAENEKTWTAGTPLRHGEDPRTTSWSVTGQEQVESPKFAVFPSNMEEIKENVLTDSTPCYRNRYFGENRFGHHRLCQESSQIAKGEESTRGKWRTLEKPWQQGLPESSLGGRLDHHPAAHVFGNVLDDRGPTKCSHLERSSHTDGRVVSPASRHQIVGPAAVQARDAASRTRREMSEKNDRSDAIFADTPSSRRWTSTEYDNRVSLQNDRHVYTRQTTPRAKSLSPSLMLNVGSGNFGSLESIRAYYKTMGRLTKSSSSSSSSSNSKGSSSSSSSSSSQYPETGANGPIDLSRRVQIRGHHDIEQSEPTDMPPSVKSNARCSAHTSTFCQKAPSDNGPKTGSTVDVETYRKRYALSISLPNSRISSPSPDSHLPPKKRRYLSYEWLATSESMPAGEGNDRGMWMEDDMVKPAGRASPLDDALLSR